MTDHYQEQQQARRKALRLLEHMDRTERGLTDRLRQAGFSEEAAEDAVSYVREFGYINDERYAFNYIMYRIHDKSRQKIFQELQQKGVDRQTIQSAWEEAEELEAPDEHTLLLSQIEKKYPPDTEIDERQMRRLLGYFARRGFRQSEITSALEELNITLVKNIQTNN